MKPLALKWRLTIPIALAVTIAMSIIGALAYDNFRELVLAQTDRSLVSATETIKTVVNDSLPAGDRATHVQLVLATMAERPAEKGSSEEEERPQLMARIWMDDGVTNSIAIGSPVGIQALTVKTQTLTKPPVGQSLLFDIESSKGCYRASWMRVAMKDGP
ncbi:MAG: hypothetical protein WCL44_13275, partial [bacterium]